jgi:hypothetical protein
MFYQNSTYLAAFYAAGDMVSHNKKIKLSVAKDLSLSAWPPASGVADYGCCRKGECKALILGEPVRKVFHLF